MFGSSFPPVVCKRAHVLFTLVVFVCAYWCPIHIVLVFCVVFLRLVYVARFSGLSFRYSLDCPFLIALSVFSGLSFFDCPFGILWIVLS